MNECVIYVFMNECVIYVPIYVLISVPKFPQKFFEKLRVPYKDTSD